MNPVTQAKAHYLAANRDYMAKDTLRRSALRAVHGDDHPAANVPTPGAPVDPGPKPRLRMLASMPEVKVLMQQGVSEAPSFQAYLVGGGLQAYENQVRRR